MWGGRATTAVLAVLVGLLMLFAVRGLHRYSPPGFGGPEPKANHEAALEILERGRTEMTFHPTGYAYFTAVVYGVLPQVPLSVLLGQILLLPVLVMSVGRIAETVRTGSGVIARVLTALYYPLGYYAASYSAVYPAMVATTAAVALFIPHLTGRDSTWRTIGAGACLGLATCLRPNLGAIGIVMAVASLVATRNVKRTVPHVSLVALVSSTPVIGMTWLNPPERGQFMRGSQALNRSLLQGTYQYADRWWDWDWYEDPRDSGHQAYMEHIARIERKTGRPFADPASQLVVRREALQRMKENPALSLKKAIISTVRVWILVPTHLTSMWPKVLIASQEVLLLGLSLVAGVLVLRRYRAASLLLIGVMLVVTVSHTLLHVEPRYSLPGKGVELALAGTALAAAFRRDVPAVTSTRA